MILGIGIIVYAIVMIVHLLMCYIENEVIRKITKPLLMLILLVTSIIYGYRTNHYLPLLYVAISLGLAGDVLLIFDNNRVIFGLGGVTFFFGHIFYIAQMINLLSFSIKWYFYLILFVVLIGWCIFITPRLKKNLSFLALPCSIYSFILLFGVVIGITSFFTNFSVYNVMLICGFLLFIISDTILVISVFYKNRARYHFYLMMPYIVAQALLAYGILLR